MHVCMYVCKREKERREFKKMTKMQTLKNMILNTLDMYKIRHCVNHVLINAFYISSIKILYIIILNDSTLN